MPASYDPKYSPSTWRNDTTEVQLPSGQFCLVQKISLQRMMAEGIIDDFDSLTGIVNQQHIGPKSKAKKPMDRQPKKEPDLTPEQLAAKILGDSEQLTRVLKMMDQVVMSVVVAPPVLPAPEAGEARSEDPNVAYIDWVDEADKAYLFNWAMGGIKDLERFRQELSELGDGVGADKDLGNASE